MEQNRVHVITISNRKHNEMYRFAILNNRGYPSLHETSGFK